MNYLCTENGLKINATQIVSIHRRRSRVTPGLLLRLESGADYLASRAWLGDGVPKIGDYLGFIDNSPFIMDRADFEARFQKNGAMCFGRALQRLQLGERIARAGWSKDSWICLGDAHPGLEADKFFNQHTRAMAEANGGTAPVHAYIIAVEDGQVQMGWVPNQPQLLAHDWHVV